MSAHTVAGTPAEGPVWSEVKTEEEKKTLSLAVQSGLDAVEREKAVSLAVHTGLKSEVAVYLAVRGRLEAEQVKKILNDAVRRGLEADEAEKILYFAVRSGLHAEDTLSVAIRTGLKTEEEIYAVLLKKLLASLYEREEDTELDEWVRPSNRKKSAPKFPFFLFKMKASAKKARVSWWRKKYDIFPPERPGYTYARRVLRLVIGPHGFDLEGPGDGGHRGALSYHTDVRYMGWPRPKEGVFVEGSSVPLREVAVMKRLPGGDGIAIMSYVKGLGVKLGDILFVLQCWSITVALSFTEKSFYVSSKFTEEPLYAMAGLDFIDITVPVENLIRKLYMMYELEEQDKREMEEKQNHLVTGELMCQQEEHDKREMEDKKNHVVTGELMCQQEDQDKREMEEKQNHLVTGELMCQQEELRLQQENLEQKKREVLKQKREEAKKYKSMREEMKKMFRKPITGEELEALRKFKGRRRTMKRNTIPYEESDWVNLFEDELCQSGEKCNGSIENSMEPILKM
jgi:hypothetical protein